VTTTERPEVAWDEVARELRPYLLSRLRSEADADDVLQDVLLKMHGGLGALRDNERLVPWAYRIARRAVIDHHRRRGRRATPAGAATDLLASEPEATTAPPPMEEGDASESLTAVIAQFVAALPSPYRETLELTELQGRSHREAADTLGISLTATKSRVQRGRAQLRIMLERCCAIELDARNGVMSVVPRSAGSLPDGCCDGGC
jgi:RNA polymerase sigma-70 factor (ECF subfamily)